MSKAARPLGGIAGEGGREGGRGKEGREKGEEGEESMRKQTGRYFTNPTCTEKIKSDHNKSKVTQPMTHS